MAIIKNTLTTARCETGEVSVTRQKTGLFSVTNHNPQKPSALGDMGIL